MKNLPSFEDWLVESSGDELKLKRNKPVQFNPHKHPDLKGELFDLIQTAYAEIGGHVKFKTPDDIFSDPELDWWEGEDLHGSPDMDLLMFGKKTKYGIKFTGVGHDGEKDSKREYLDASGRDLKKLGFYIEVSGKLAEILINKYNAPILEDESEVQKILARPIKWMGKREGYTGNGWYERSIGGGMHHKILLGRPKV